MTHDPLEALVLTDQLLVLEDGRIVQAGSPAQVARQPATDYVAKLVGLNLYAGQAFGSRVALADGGVFETAGRTDARGRAGRGAALGHRGRALSSGRRPFGAR